MRPKTVFSIAGKRRGGWLRLAASVGVLLVLACGRDHGSPDGRAVIVLGFDGMDPGITQHLLDAGRLPNVARLLQRGGHIDRLETSVPPQSPVAWSNFVTGMDAGGHGIFDFIHRDPEKMIPVPSTAKTTTSDRHLCIRGVNIPLGSGELISLRRGTPFWDVLEKKGIETTVLRMPANFPPSGTATRELSGMGTSDLQGTDGTFSFFTSELFAFAGQDITGGKIYELDIYDNVVNGKLHGPANPFRCEEEPLTQEFTGYLDPKRQTVKIELGGQEAVLKVGEWSPWLNVEFDMAPTQTLHGICRMYLRSLDPEFELYVSPIDVDPYAPAFPISTPESYAAELADATGLFYTEGMPEDTKAITDGVFTVGDFLSQSQNAGAEQYGQYPWVLDQFLARRGGFLFYYVGNLDLTGHVMWRSLDPGHPFYDEAADAPYVDEIPKLYVKLDELVGQTLDKVDDKTLVIVMSDHGFTSWRRVFHLNAWLAQEGYLVAKNPSGDDPGFLTNIDWSKSRAYGVGMSGLYINVKGRERNGIVPESQRETLAREIGNKLLAVTDPDTQQPAITELFYREDFESRGALEVGPDAIVGYTKGTRGSNGSALGEAVGEVFSDNDGRWTGDHIMDHRVVPGLLITSRPLIRPATRLQDLAASILAEFGIDGFPQPTTN